MEHMLTYPLPLPLSPNGLLDLQSVTLHIVNLVSGGPNVGDVNDTILKQPKGQGLVLVPAIRQGSYEPRTGGTSHRNTQCFAWGRGELFLVFLRIVL